MKIRSKYYVLSDLNANYNKEFEKIRRRMIVILSIIIALIIFTSNPTFILPSYFYETIDREILFSCIQFTLISIVFLILYLYLRDVWFNKVIFLYKNSFMKDYYDTVNEKVDSLTTDHLECELKFIPATPNARFIGMLESLLYTFAILIQNYIFLGIILAIRSYITVSSHPNKEESEFYIIELFGSLIYSILFTSIYIFTVNSYFGEINIVNSISTFFYTI